MIKYWNEVFQFAVTTNNITILKKQIIKPKQETGTKLIKHIHSKFSVL
jgi:hypothetical protein